MLRVAFSPSIIPRSLRLISALPIANAFRPSEQHLVQRMFPNLITCSNFSTASTDALKKVDRKLVKVLRSEIKSYDSSLVQMPQVPADFPFEIEDIPCRVIVKLKREYEGEKIELDAFNPIDPNDDSDGDDEEETAKKSRSDDEPFIPLRANISKEDGENLEIMWFGVASFIGYSRSFRVNGISFTDEKLIDWVGILRDRGIDDSMPGFLMEYMSRRSDRNRWLSLKKFKEFVKA